MAALLLTGACSGDDPSSDASSSSGDARFPDVVAVDVEAVGGDAFRFDVTISSPYDGASRYADGWRVLGSDGTEYGVRVLAHDHAGEQPFTRSHTVEVPRGVSVVTIEGRDLVNGWGGATVVVELPGR